MQSLSLGAPVALSRHALAARAASIALVALALLSPLLGSVPPVRGDQGPRTEANDSILICREHDPGSQTARTTRMPTAEAENLIRSSRSYLGPCAELGPPVQLGGGSFRSSVQIDDGRLLSIGVLIEAQALDHVSVEPHDGNRCLDLNADRVIQPYDECVGGHERVLFLPLSLVPPPFEQWTSEELETPFKWILINWNPAGHAPLGAWAAPHFDFHFFIQPLSERNQVRMGECAMLVSCNDLARGVETVPPEFVPSGWEDRGIVEFAMGNHIIDPTSPEFNGEFFTHTFIYGAWAGAVSFHETMITLAYLADLRDGRRAGECFRIDQPEAWQERGHYPTRYCIRYRANREEFAVSLQGFELRAATW